MARQYPNVFIPCLAIIIFTTYVQRLYHLYSTTPERTPSCQHLYCPHLVSTPYLLSIYIWNAISHAHVQSVHHLFCPCPVSTSSLLPITSENHNSRVYVKSIHYLSSLYRVIMSHKMLCPCSVRIPTFLPLYLCTVSTPHILPKYPRNTPSLQTMSSLYAISTTNVQTVPHFIKSMSSHKNLYSP